MPLMCVAGPWSGRRLGFRNEVASHNTFTRERCFSSSRRAGPWRTSLRRKKERWGVRSPSRALTDQPVAQKEARGARPRGVRFVAGLSAGLRSPGVKRDGRGPTMPSVEYICNPVAQEGPKYRGWPTSELSSDLGNMARKKTSTRALSSPPTNHT